MILLFVTAALAGSGDYRLAGSGGLGGGVGTPSSYGDGAPSASGYAVGRLLLQGERAALELGGREGVAGQDLRSWGGLFVGARTPLGERLYGRVGFAHHHEVELSLAQENPLQAALGSLPGIRHRSGAELGLGALLPVEERMLDDRLGVGGDLSVVVFPDALGPRVYGFLELNVTVGLGQRRAAP